MPPKRLNVQFSTVVEREADQGARLYALEDHGLPIVAVAVAARAGFCHERHDEIGFAAMVAALVRGWAEAGRYSDFGTMLDVSVGPSQITLKCTVRREDVEEVLKLMIANLRYAQADDVAFASARQTLRRELANLRARAEELAGLGIVLGSHGVAPPVLALASGSSETLASIDRARLDAWRDLHVRPGRLTFALAGDVWLDELAGCVSSALGDWSASTATTSVYAPATNRGPSIVITPLRGAQRSVLAFGGSRSPYGSPDEMVEYEADVIAGKWMCKRMKDLDGGFDIDQRIWTTRFGSVVQGWSSFTHADFEKALDAFMEFSAELLVDPSLSEQLVIDRLEGWGATTRFMCELQGAEGSLTRLLHMVEHGLPADAILARFERLAAGSAPEIAATLRRCYALSQVRVTIVVDFERLRSISAKLERYGAVVQTTEQLTGT